MVIDNYWEDYSSQDARKFKYDFCQLKGIIFGAKTPVEEKRQIIDIIKEKCRENGRSEFSFYQAVDDVTHNIVQLNPYRVPINK